MRLAGEYSVVQCPRCHVGRTSPFPSQVALASAYGEWYRPRGGRFQVGGDSLLKLLRSAVAHWIDGLAPPGPILDVGCGDGSMLDALAHDGRVVLGLERNSTRADVRGATVEECAGGWAAITYWHSLEHLPDPRHSLTAAAQRLLPGGLIVIAIPNFGSLQAQCFGSRWLHLDLPRHLTHITTPALTTALRSEGLTIAQVSYVRGGQVALGWLHGLVGLLPGHPDVYQLIRRPSARNNASPKSVLPVLAAMLVLSPVAVVAAAVEVALRRGGTVAVVACRPRERPAPQSLARW
ncbi:MAG: class I SAM-dependent methyltransferase [Candidatus Dormibacteria bacterium]